MRYLFRLFTPIIVLAMVALSLAILKERQVFDTRGLVQIDPIPKTKELIEKEEYAKLMSIYLTLCSLIM